jgi:arylsulfatase A-like enzyme
MAETTPNKPNVVWIMADDLSIGDLGCYGQQRIKTPNLDQLACEGMRFTECYSGNTVCAPSRSSLMQGLHPGHATVRDNMVRTYRHSLQPDDYTVAQLFKEAGYATGQFGKWGLGLRDQPGIPNNMGFDEFFGYLNQRKAHSYYPEYLWHNTEKIEFPQHQGHDHTAGDAYDENGNIIINGTANPEQACYSFDVYHQKSLEWVKAHFQEPFFLYLPYTPPHPALQAPYLGQYTDLDWPNVQLKIWAAMITHMDKAIGELFALLKELGVYDNTLIFYVSDNGYSAANISHEPTADEWFHHRGPWKGRKGNLGQGGIRVPAIAAWPGMIEPGTVSDHTWAFWDFLPTVAEILGLTPPKRCDGISLLPTLLGRPEEQEQHDYLYWEFKDAQSIRMGDRYIYRPHPDEPIEVYDNYEDPGQFVDLADQEPELVATAQKIMEKEHEPTLWFPEPGQSYESWRADLAAEGITPPDNVNG